MVLDRSKLSSFLLDSLFSIDLSLKMMFGCQHEKFYFFALVRFSCLIKRKHHQSFLISFSGGIEGGYSPRIFYLPSSSCSIFLSSSSIFIFSGSLGIYEAPEPGLITSPDAETAYTAGGFFQNLIRPTLSSSFL